MISKDDPSDIRIAMIRRAIGVLDNPDEFDRTEHDEWVAEQHRLQAERAEEARKQRLKRNLNE